MQAMAEGPHKPTASCGNPSSSLEKGQGERLRASASAQREGTASIFLAPALGEQVKELGIKSRLLAQNPLPLPPVMELVFPGLSGVRAA